MTGHSEERIGQKQAVYLTVFLFLARTRSYDLLLRIFKCP